MRKIKYKIIDGTSYHKETPSQVIFLLEHSRWTKQRFKIHYGDIKTGKAWGDIDVCHIGRSTGSIKIPLVIKNSRSIGGIALLDHCIVKIEHANKKYGTKPLFDITK